METLTIDTQLKNKILWLVENVKTSELDILRQAIDWYVEKIKKQQILLSYAGLLTETEAETYTQTIFQNRYDKTITNW